MILESIFLKCPVAFGEKGLNGSSSLVPDIFSQCNKLIEGRMIEWIGLELGEMRAIEGTVSEENSKINDQVPNPGARVQRLVI